MSESNDHIQQLRARGHRMTPQRRMILEVLQASDHHLTADEIGQALGARYPALRVDDATIYRTLKWLRDSEIVSETSLGQGRMVYALLSHHQHHHLVCDHCRTIIEADPAILEPVRAEIERRYGFAARLDHSAIFGLCARCRSALPGEL